MAGQTEEESIPKQFPRRVIKVGGSLLDLQGIGDAVNQWILTQPVALNLIVVGGGDIVEAVRKLDRIHEFEASCVHWWCVDLLSTTARIAANQIPQCGLIVSPAELKRVLESEPESRAMTMSYVVVPRAFYSRDLHEAGCRWCRQLPQSWDTTTDSIAALLGLLSQADELILMKSVDSDVSTTASDVCRLSREWCELGLVDAAFPDMVSSIDRIRWVNLRRASA